MKIVVIVKKPYQKPEVKEIEDTLQNWQAIVGGYIQCLPFPQDDNINIICNEEGKLDASLEGNVFIPEYNDCLLGNIAFASFDDEGEFQSLNEEQIKKVKEYIKNFQLTKRENIRKDFDIISVKAKAKMKNLNDAME